MRRMMMLFSAMLASLVVSADTWTDPETGVKWNYCIVGGDAVLGGNYTLATFDTLSGDVVIPPNLNGRPVVAIGSFAFSFFRGVTSFSIPESVTNIQFGAFQDCTKLASVNIPNGIREINFNTFGGCSNLTSVVLPVGVTNIGGKAFARCVNLSSFNIPSGVREIGAEAFYGCKSIHDELSIPENVECVNDYVFYGCSSLEKINFPKRLKYVGVRAFDGCNLKSVVLPDSIPSSSGDGILTCAFANNVNLEEVYIPHFLNSPNGIFEGCVNITKATIPATWALADLFPDSYKRITDVTMLEGWQIPDNAFAGCVNLRALNITNVCANYVGNNAFAGCENLQSVKLPTLVRSFGTNVFNGCSRLLEVNIPDEVETISDYMFYGCKQLQHVEIPKGVTKIGKKAYSGCVSIKSIDLPATIRYVYAHAFEGCQNLGSATISNVFYLGDEVFSGCEYLTNVVFMSDAPSVCGTNIYFATPIRLFSQVPCGSVGWQNPVTTNLPDMWQDRAIGHGNPRYSFTVTNILELTNTVVSTVYETNTVTETLYRTNTIEKTETILGTNVVEQVHEIEVEKVVTVEKVETIFVTNYIDVVVTNYVGLGDGEIGKVSESVLAFEPSSGFDGSQKQTLNGIAFDGDGVFCGLVQITAAKATKKGVKVGGFLVLDDGKKQTLKSTIGVIDGEFLTVRTKIGKIGEIGLMIGANGFRGQVGNLTVISANPDDTSGVLKGTMTLSYFDSKTSKLRTKRITISGVAIDGEATGSADVKGGTVKSFAAEIE